MRSAMNCLSDNFTITYFITLSYIAYMDILKQKAQSIQKTSVDHVTKIGKISTNCQLLIDFYNKSNLNTTNLRKKKISKSKNFKNFHSRELIS
ncbi:hypothetical protein BpHYR1_030350 [Brachionus plicatilis]|uniref:Uncharacterized protein n=1 Tax=Brachionus plicatilis TaxID=10195 RepID=A0A3M7RC00_BRAPC|nr:hypothetical protein BpHYR1_030350 [Brachionus plicatilis]